MLSSYRTSWHQRLFGAASYHSSARSSSFPSVFFAKCLPCEQSRQNPRSGEGSLSVGLPVETLQLYSASLWYVLISVEVKCRTRGPNPRGICKAVTPTDFWPTCPIISIAAKRSTYHVRERIWLGLPLLRVRAMPSNFQAGLGREPTPIASRQTYLRNRITLLQA